ncbi:MAG: MmgE/PrpD family protein [Thermoleophilia bacterium]
MSAAAERDLHEQEYSGDHFPERILVRAARALQWPEVPAEARKAVHDLFLDWIGSAVAGSESKQAGALRKVVESGLVGGGASGLVEGAGQVEDRGPALQLAGLVGGFTQLPVLGAALVNGAAGHVVEMDDLHNASIYHPAACVFPAALAVAEARRLSGARLLEASIAGYEVSLRVGEALGPEHYVYFHTTGTAGTIGACVAASRLLDLDEEQSLWALGNAASQAAGLWQFLGDGAMTKQLHTAKAAFNGLLAALLAAEGFTGPQEGLMGRRALIPATTAAGASVMGAGQGEEETVAQRVRLLQGISTDGGSARFTLFKTPEVSLKFHASCRHTHPAVDALLELRNGDPGLNPEEVKSIRAYVYSVAYDRLHGVSPSSPWAAKFNLPFCLAQAALRGSLGLDAFNDEALADPEVRALMEKVEMVVDPDLDTAYPRQWAARVEVETRGGQRLAAKVQAPKGDPENPLTDEELTRKFLDLAQLRLSADVSRELLARIRGLPELSDTTHLFAGLQEGS